MLIQLRKNDRTIPAAMPWFNRATPSRPTDPIGISRQMHFGIAMVQGKSAEANRKVIADESVIHRAIQPKCSPKPDHGGERLLGTKQCC
jgi:hypothetical protein